RRARSGARHARLAGGAARRLRAALGARTAEGVATNGAWPSTGPGPAPPTPGSPGSTSTAARTGTRRPATAGGRRRAWCRTRARIPPASPPADVDVVGHELLGE